MSQIKGKFIEDLAITTAKIVDANVTGAKIASAVALAGAPTTSTASGGDSSTKIATTAFVAGEIAAQSGANSWKNHVRVASASSIADLSSITLSDFDGSAQGITLIAGDRVLVKDTASSNGVEGLDAKRNGLYEVVGTALVRTSDGDAANELESAAQWVDEGDHADESYVVTTENFTLDTDAIVFQKSSGLGQANADAENSVSVDSAADTIKSIKFEGEQITLDGTDITNQYVDLANVAFSASAVNVIPEGGIPQTPTTDYTVSLTGGAGGVTRVSFAGDLATGGDAALIAADIIRITYEYL